MEIRSRPILSRQELIQEKPWVRKRLSQSAYTSELKANHRWQFREYPELYDEESYGAEGGT